MYIFINVFLLFFLLQIMNRFYKTGWSTDAPFTFAPDPVRPWQRGGLAEVEAWPTPRTATTTASSWGWWPEDDASTTTNPLAAAAAVLVDVEVEGDLEWWAWALIALGAVLALVALAGLVPLWQRFG